MIIHLFIMLCTGGANALKLYQIDYLLEVCRQGSFSKAADALLVSRPAISRAMKDLEDEFGVSIFQRTTTGVVPTEAGEIILDKSRKISHLLEELRSEVGALKSSEDDQSDHQLHIGISFTARCCFLPFISEFWRVNPDVQMKLTDLSDSFVDRGYLNPDYDLEIALSADKAYEDVDFLEIEDSVLTFCCSPKHPLAGRSHVSIMDIKDEPLVGLNYLEEQKNLVFALFDRFGLRANMAYMTQQVSFLREMVRENLCCSIKPRQSIENDPDIVTIPIDEAEPLHLRILWNSSIRHNSAFHSFIDYSRRMLADRQKHLEAKE